jgi:hypothetical protein
MTSPFYGYRLALPSADWFPAGAKQLWDGVAQIDSNGSYVDQAYGPGSALLFVYGAPVTSSLDAWAKKGQQQTADWHGCPATPETTRDIVVGGEPARLNGFHCQGLWAQKAFVVRHGFGWAFNELSAPGQEAADSAALADLLMRVEWTR